MKHADILIRCARKFFLEIEDPILGRASSAMEVDRKSEKKFAFIDMVQQMLGAFQRVIDI